MSLLEAKCGEENFKLCRNHPHKLLIPLMGQFHFMTGRTVVVVAQSSSSRNVFRLLESEYDLIGKRCLRHLLEVECSISFTSRSNRGGLGSNQKCSCAMYAIFELNEF
jgi:hypothetical protein